MTNGQNQTGFLTGAGGPGGLFPAVEEKPESKFGGTPVQQESKFGGIPAQGVTEAGELNVLTGGLMGINIGLARGFGGEPIRRGFEALGVRTAVPFEELSRPAQIAFRGGETFGQAVSFAMGPFGLVKAGIQGPKFIQPILEAARRSPLAFSLTEAFTTFGAAQGAALAEAADPGDELTRLVLEVTGGVINPAGAAFRATRGGIGSLTRFVKTFSRAGREDQAAAVLRSVVDEFGEDLPNLIRILEEPSEVTLTAGRKTGSEALLAIESKLAQRSAEFERTSRKTTEDAFKSIRETIDKLVASGDPQALRAAAILRKQHFDDVLTQRLQNAQQNAAEVAARLGGNKRASSTRAFEILDEAVKDARKIEASIWGKVADDIPVPVEGLRAARDTARARLLKEEAVPFAGSIKRILTKGPQTSGELKKLRSRLLAKGRTLRAEKKFDEASIANDLADGILDDMAGVPAFDEARGFSRSLNEVFSQGFGGVGLARTAQGGQRISPELLLDRAFGKGGDVRFRELQEAADFGAGVFGNVMRNEQEAFVRAAAESVLDNGIINPSKLRNFIRSNAELLDRFPALKADLGDATSAQKLIDDVTSATRVASRAVKERAAFARLLNVENPTVVVGRILRGPTPQRDYRQLARLAKQSGPGAVDGLKSATLENAVSTASRGGFTFGKFRNALFDPVGKFSPIETMRDTGVISVAEVKSLNSLLDRAANLERSIASTGRIDALIDEPDALFDLAVRIAGVRAAAISPISAGGPGQIVIAGAASRTARRFFEKVPATRVVEVLTEAAKNPKFTAALLRKAKTVPQKVALERQINAFLLQTGIIDEE